jgi:hypothetical protein
MVASEKSLYWLMSVVCVGLLVTGLSVQGPQSALRGLIALQLQPARLVADFTQGASSGAALLNVAVMGSATLLLVGINRVKLSGPTMAALLTIMGFSFFGKTLLNAAPIMGGVYAAALVAGKPFRSYILFALFGTALGPLVTYMIVEAGLGPQWGGVAGIVAGGAAGFVVPAVAVALLRLHEGYNLYNIGFASGFLALFAASFLVASQRSLQSQMVWNSAPGAELRWLPFVLGVLFIAWGAAMDKRRLWSNLNKLWQQPGRLPSDFIDTISPGSALVNAGLLALAATGYLTLIDAPLNGPVIGGVLTVMGFATFGKHLANCWPIALGVVGATLVLHTRLNDPAPVLALLFGTTLAPLAGQFGWPIGVVAGFIHLCIVLQTTAWHGGLALYNNGLAGGLTASLMVALIEWFRSNKR